MGELGNLPRERRQGGGRETERAKFDTGHHGLVPRYMECLLCEQAEWWGNFHLLSEAVTPRLRYSLDCMARIPQLPSREGDIQQAIDCSRNAITQGARA